MTVALLQFGSAIVINASLAWMAGVWLSRLWLRDSARAHNALDPILATSMLPAACLCLLGSGAGLWAATAVMSGASLGPATSMLVLVATDTALGHASLLGMAMLLAIAGISLFAGRTSKTEPKRNIAHKLANKLVIPILLLGFAFTRASSSHAADNGLLSVGFAVEWLHLVLVASWTGAVAVAGWMVLPFAQRMPAMSDRGSVLPDYLASLSLAATLALAAIIASGLYNSWHRIGALDNLLGNLLGNPYGNVLSVKVALVLSAVALGGHNKWIGFPYIIATRSPRALARVIAILRVESLLLVAALSAAAVLVSLPPPASF